MRRPPPTSPMLFDVGPAEGYLTDFSEDGLYRYRIAKPLKQAQPMPKTIGICALNPSDGTATKPDPSLGRFEEFAMREGGTRLVVVNMFAWIDSEPTALLHVADPVGPRNDEAIERMAAEVDLVIVGWGSRFRYDRRKPPLGGRDVRVLELLLRHQKEVYSLGKTIASSQPCHPLYLSGTTKLIVYASRST